MPATKPSAATKVLVTSIGLGYRGSGLYSATTYLFPDKRERRSKYFPGALIKEVRPDIVIMLLTAKAKSLVWEEHGMHTYISRMCGKRTKLHILSIPDGAKDEELWEIFAALAFTKEKERFIIPSRSDVILDITHALRSVPMVVLNALSYLSQARDITIQNIYYAAFEAGEQTAPKPVFSLRASLLVPWVGAVAEFKRTGDSSQIADLIASRQIEYYTDPKVKSTLAPLTKQPTRMKNVADTLKALSLALDLGRPLAVMDEADRLRTHMLAMEQEFTLILPFQALRELVEEEFAPLALAKAEAQHDPEKFLRKQYQLICWYMRHQRYLQAVLNSLEWIVSYAMVRDGVMTLMSVEARTGAEARLWEAVIQARGTDAALDVESMRLFKIWNDHKDLRNDLAHCGMRDNHQDPVALSATAKKLVESITPLGEVL